jgi:ubiquinone/menaquinone biosynthesis C-methylase UbiE
MNGGKSTSWGHVADWYNEHLSERDTYHSKVIFPNLLRVMDIKKGETVLDVPTGQGAFAKMLAEAGAEVIAVDIAKELVAIAERKRVPGVRYFVSPSHRLTILSDQSVDKAACVLGIQNIENVAGTFKEIRRVLRPGGSMHIVMNHPAFRIPKASSWGWDTSTSRQYRRIDAYLSEREVSIDMHPGQKGTNRVQTISYHRPLQWYFKLLGKHGFSVDRLEEWISPKQSVSGPRAKEENRIRKEIPLFLYLRAKTI